MAKIENIHCTICTQPISSSWQNALPPALATLEQRGVRRYQMLIDVTGSVEGIYAFIYWKSVDLVEWPMPYSQTEGWTLCPSDKARQWSCLVLTWHTQYWNSSLKQSKHFSKHLKNAQNICNVWPRLGTLCAELSLICKVTLGATTAKLSFTFWYICTTFTSNVTVLPTIFVTLKALSAKFVYI